MSRRRSTALTGGSADKATGSMPLTSGVTTALGASATLILAAGQEHQASRRGGERIVAAGNR